MFRHLKEQLMHIYFKYKLQIIRKLLLSYIYLLIKCTSRRSSLPILFLKYEYTLRFSNFLQIGSSNSSCNCWFDIIVDYF